MSEEEKKAIEYLKDKDIDIVYGNKEHYNSVVYKKAVKTLLNLIEKQQKEINRQKEINTFINHQNLEDKYEEVLEKVMTKFLNNNIDNDFISKSKIKEINENTDMYYEFYDEVMKLVESEEK